MKKCIIAMVFAVTLMCGFVIIPLQADDYDSDLTQLREVTYQLIEQSKMGRMVRGLSVDEDAVLPTEIDMKLRDLSLIFLAAQYMVGTTRNLENELPPMIIVGWSDNGRNIFLSNERYVEFADLISDFTGIPEEDIYFTILNGVPYHPWDSTPVEIDWCPEEASMRTAPTDEEVDHFLEERNRNTARSYIPGLFPPGTPIVFRLPGGGSKATKYQHIQ